jgi:Protein of unknown function (DUF3800)
MTTSGGLPDFSDYIVFVDESGSPTLSPLDPEYPIFVLVLCVFKKSAYAAQILPAISKLKFEHFGHDTTVLHGSDIRKERRAFSKLVNVGERKRFLADVNNLVTDAQMHVIAHIIDKRLITGIAAQSFAHPSNDPYYVALRMCLFSLFGLLSRNGQEGRLTHIVAEARGSTEDGMLKQDFDRHMAELSSFSERDGRYFRRFPLELLFVEKKRNSAGLQFADLTGHPIGRNYLNPDQENRAFEIVKTKIYGQVGRSP